MVDVARSATLRLGPVALVEEAVIPDDLLHQRLELVHDLLAVAVGATEDPLGVADELGDGVLAVAIRLAGHPDLPDFGSLTRHGHVRYGVCNASWPRLAFRAPILDLEAGGVKCGAARAPGSNPALT